MVIRCVCGASWNVRGNAHMNFACTCGAPIHYQLPGVPVAVVYHFMPKWRMSDKVVEIFENLPLISVENNPDWRHDAQGYRADLRDACGGVDFPRVQVRFCVTSSGRLLVGDAWSVMHKDICCASEATNERAVILAGSGTCWLGDVPEAIASRWNLRPRVWDVRVQSFEATQDILPRLTTWNDFTDGVNYVFNSWTTELL